eukprot:14022199-Alexandrium_andersonii.AAC.1
MNVPGHGDASGFFEQLGNRFGGTPHINNNQTAPVRPQHVERSRVDDNLHRSLPGPNAWSGAA